ncbi:MAG: hypothetical protein WD872_17530 [Pirellulaceae bacterium]
MKKPKIKLDSDKLKSFFVNHVEKIVLVCVLGLMVWFVYQGYSLPGLEANRTPSRLMTASTETLQFINQPERWTEVAKEREVTSDLTDKVVIENAPTDPSKYYLPRAWNPPNFPKLSPRMDPTLFPPQNLLVEAIIGPLATFPTSEDERNALDLLPVEETKKPVPRPRRRQQRSTAGYGYGSGSGGDMYSGGGSADMYGAEGSGYGMPAGPPAAGRGAKKGKAKSRVKAAPASGMGGLMSGGPGMSGMGSDMYGPGSSEMSGSGSSDMGGMYGMGGQSGGMNPESIYGFKATAATTIARPTGAMVIRAVVPFEKQSEEFKNSLGNSLDYLASRDQPAYLHFQVKRMEIPVDKLDSVLADLDWEKDAIGINVTAALVEAVGSPATATTPARFGTWAGRLNEVIDPQYFDMKLTHPAPPFMQREVWDLLTHPDVPLASIAPVGGYTNPLLPGATKPAAGDAPVRDLPTGMPGQMPGGSMYGPGGGMGSGMPGMGSGMPGMGSGMPGMGSDMYSSGGSSGMGSDMYSSGGSSGGMASGMYGMGMGGMALAPPKYKLVRFTDTTVEPGKFYSYRLQVLLHDPNHPAVGYAPPAAAGLDSTVRDRIRELDAMDAKSTRPNNRTFWVESPWSVPSKPVSLPSTSRFFAGAVSQPASTVIVLGRPAVSGSQPSATALAVMFDPAKAVDVPTEAEVFRGSIMNFVQDAQVFHPVTHRVVDLTKHTIQTDAVVADMRGGETIPSLDKKADSSLTTPGELLFVDAAGNLHVHNETEDIESFRRFLLPEVEENPAAGGYPGDPGGYPGGDMYEGSEGSGYGYGDMSGGQSGGPRSGR